MAKHGGRRPGAGRKPKAKEIHLIEELDKYLTPEMFAEELGTLIMNEKGKTKLDALKLYADYRFGKPAQSIDMTTNGESFNPIKPIQWVKSTSN